MHISRPLMMTNTDAVYVFLCINCPGACVVSALTPQLTKAFENREGDLHWQRPSQHMLFVSGNAEILLLREIDAIASKNSSLLNLNMRDT